MKLLDINYWLYLVDKVLRRGNVANGFIDYKPSGTDEIHREDKTEVLGNAKVLLNPKGDWINYRPTGEAQKRNGSETMSCVSQSACNAIETILNFYLHKTLLNEATNDEKEIVKIFKYFGIIKENSKGITEANASDRYIAKLSGTTYRGNTQKRVADAIRHYGLIPEADWGWANGWNNYYADIPDEIIQRGKKLLEYIEFNYEWAHPSLFKNSVKYAPLQTSLYAWNGQKNGLYYRVRYTRNHATIRDASDSRGININDSYDPFAKKTTHDFNYGYDMVFSLHLKQPLKEWNQKKINELKKKGIEYILLVEDYDEYKRGLWNLTSNGLIKVEAKDVPEKERNDAFIVKSAEDGKLVPYAPINFQDLVT